MTGFRKSLIFVGSVILIVLTYTSCSTDSYIGRWFVWRASDIEDYQKFPAFEFEASQNPFEFVDGYKLNLDTVKVSKTSNKKSELLEILENTGTTAFLIIRNDTLLYEKYLNGYYRAAINTSFSVAKSITSLMVGKAIDENIIGSVDDLVTEYIPELEETDPGYGNLRISHLLNMQSGIQFKDHDLPWGDKPKAYYNPNLRERIMELPLTSEPGIEFQYNSYNPILTGMIIEKASGSSPARYFENKIWNELGMEYSGSWSMDSEGSGMTKMESGLNLRAVDFAKFGRLVINKGNWDGKQLISKGWMNQVFEVSDDYKVAEIGEDIFYRNFWWIYSNNQKNSNIISGWGHLGQYLYIFPNSGVLIVRMGEKTGGVKSWGRIFIELEHILELDN